MGEFRQALNEANLHGHYNLFQQFFGEDMTRKLDEAGTHIDNAAAKKALTAAERSARLEELLSEVDVCYYPCQVHAKVTLEWPCSTPSPARIQRFKGDTYTWRGG